MLKKQIFIQKNMCQKKLKKKSAYKQKYTKL